MRRPAILIGVAFLLVCASPVAASPETAMASYEGGVRLPRRRDKALSAFREAATQRHPYARASVIVLSEKDAPEQETNALLDELKKTDAPVVAEWSGRPPSKAICVGWKAMELSSCTATACHRIAVAGMDWPVRAEERDDASAQSMFGLTLHEDAAGTQDQAGAAGWFRKAAEQGDAQAQNNLASIL